MQLFTADQIIQMFFDSRHLATELFGIILGSVGGNIAAYGIATWHDIAIGNWTSPNAFMLLGTTVFAFIIIRRNIFRSASYLYSLFR